MLNLIAAMPTQSMPFDVPFAAALIAGLAAVGLLGIASQLLGRAPEPRPVTGLRPATSH